MEQQVNEIVELPQPLGIYSGELFQRGLEYWEAYETLTEHRDKYSYVECFLLAHALELVLKSFLTAKSVSKNALRKRTLGHNLEALHQKCVEYAMPDVVQLDVFCRCINSMNENFDFRYPSGYNLHVPGPKHCREIFHMLLEKIGPIIEVASVSANLKFASDTRHMKGKKIRWSD